MATARPPTRGVRLTPRGRGLVWAVGLLLVDVAVAAGLGGKLWAHPSATTLGGRQDAPYTLWSFAWVARALRGGHAPFTSTALSWPQGLNLLTNASSLGLGVALSPLTRLAGPLVAFNVAATGALACTAWSAQLVIRRSGLGSWPAAAVGGLVGGFGPTAMAQTGGAHLHVAAAFLVPPMLLGTGRVATGTARRPALWGLGLGLLLVAQLLVGEELLAITAFVAVAGLLFGIRHVRWRALVSAGVAACATFEVLAAGPLWVQFNGRGHITGPIQHGDQYANDLSAFIVPAHQVWLGSAAAAGVARHFSSEGGAYLGLPLVLVCCVVALHHRWDPLVRVLAGAAALAGLLSLGSHLVVAGHATGITLPWAPLARLPLLESLLPVRFGVVIELLAGALLAIGIDDVVAVISPRRSSAGARRPSTGSVVAAAGVAALCIVPLVPPLPLRTTTWGVPAAFREAGARRVPDGTLVVVSPYPAEEDPQIEVWLAVAQARWRSAGGTYFVPGPDGRVTIGGPVPVSGAVDIRLEHGERAADLAPLQPAVLDELARDGVGAVLVGPGPHRDQVLEWWTAALGPPDGDDGVAQWRLPRPGLQRLR